MKWVLRCHQKRIQLGQPLTRTERAQYGTLPPKACTSWMFTSRTCIAWSTPPAEYKPNISVSTNFDQFFRVPYLSRLSRPIFSETRRNQAEVTNKIKHFRSTIAWREKINSYVNAIWRWGRFAPFMAYVLTLANQNLMRTSHWAKIAEIWQEFNIEEVLLHESNDITAAKQPLQCIEPVFFCLGYGQVNVVALIAGSKRLLVAVRSALYLLDWEITGDAALRLLTTFDQGLPDNVINEGKADAEGRFWAGNVLEKFLQHFSTLDKWIRYIKVAKEIDLIIYWH